MKDRPTFEPRMNDRCRKIGGDGTVCMAMDSHLMTCLSDMLINKIWPSLEFLKMVKSGDMEMSVEIVDIVHRNLDEIVTWINFLKDKSRSQELKQIQFVDNRAEAENFAQELSEALIAEKVMNRDFIQRLAALAEFRDALSGNHILRVGLYANKVSEMLDMPMGFIDRITVASTLHDIGKMGVPSDVLLKPSALTAEEFDAAKKHTSIGHKILSGSSNPVLEMAAEIACTHHENWDGSGYPRGLKRKDIPLSGMIVHVCDVYDTLRSRRPYKEPVSHKKAVSVILTGDGRTDREHFQPEVLDAFVEISPVLEEIYETHHKTGDLS